MLNNQHRVWARFISQQDRQAIEPVERPEQPDQDDQITQIQRRILSCRLCQEQGYIATAHPIVYGRSTDRVMVIGQAPGHLSVEKNMPFSGPGGRILQKWLEHAGFPPGYLHEHTYLASLTRCDPGKNPRGSGDRKPSKQEQALCRPFLDAELRHLRPQVVLLVGTMAIEEFVGKGRLEEIIGTCWEQQGMLFLPLPHPSGVSRWLNAAQHQQLLYQALDILAGWRRTYGL